MGQRSVVLVLGNQVNEYGLLGPIFQSYCQLAMRYVRTCPHDATIVVSGGNTTAGAPTEGEAGAEFIRRHSNLQVCQGKNQPEVLAETEARTTPENVRCTLALLKQEGVQADTLAVVGRRLQLWRVRACLWWWRRQVQYLGFKSIVYLHGPNDDPAWKKFIELLVLVPLTWIDPNGYHLWLLKKIARNG